MEFDTHTVSEMKPGDRAFVQKTITEADILMYAAVSTDDNPAHINAEYAKQTRFQRPMAHGMITAGLVSSILGCKLPGPGSIYVSQTLQFLAPVYAGDTLLAVAEVVRIDAEKNRVVLRTSVTNQESVMVLDGEAMVSPPKKKLSVRTGGGES